MSMLYRYLLLLAALTMAAYSQTLIDLKTQSRNVDFGSFASTRPIKVGTSAPGTCEVGELFFDSDATAGQNMFGCTSTNTWTLLSGAVGGGGTAGSPYFAPFTAASNVVVLSAATHGQGTNCLWPDPSVYVKVANSYTAFGFEKYECDDTNGLVTIRFKEPSQAGYIKFGAFSGALVYTPDFNVIQPRSHRAADNSYTVPSLAAGTCDTARTVVVSGAGTGDPVSIGLPAHFDLALSATGKVASPGTVSWRICNHTSATIGGVTIGDYIIEVREQ